MPVTIKDPNSSADWYFLRIYISFYSSANSMGRLESFQIKNVSLTLISALKLLNSRPKLAKIGHILKWDVEPAPLREGWPSELDTFAQIVNKARGLNLLQNVVFL